MEMSELLQHLRSMAQQIGVRTVYGEPVVSGDKTVIPVASVAFGFGGGFGKKPSAEEQGGGGGVGFRGWPAGYIEITPAGTRFVPVHEYRKLGSAVLAGIAIGMLWGKLRRRTLPRSRASTARRDIR
jgi:uncharacterized spore protein YtfJ